MAKRRIAQNLGASDRAATLTKNVLTSSQEGVLNSLAPLISEAGFYLAGGTALAMQLKHRRSRDFDFFTPGKFEDPHQLIKTIQTAGINFVANRVTRGTLSGSVEGVEISFMELHYPVIKPIFKMPEYTIDLVDPIDIAAMKINAIIQRGIRRDFVDIYALLKSGISIQDMIDAFEKKYGIQNDHFILTALNFFDDAESGIMPDMIWPVDWKSVKRAITKAVAEYVNRRTQH